MPGAALQRGRGSSPLHQGLKPVEQGLALGPHQPGGKQQGRRRFAADGGLFVAAQLAEGIHVAVELALFRQQAFHQRSVLLVLFEAPQQ